METCMHAEAPCCPSWTDVCYANVLRDHLSYIPTLTRNANVYMWQLKYLRSMTAVPSWHASMHLVTDTRRQKLRA